MIVAVIPAYNEESMIGEVVKGAKKYVNKVIVVDDGSTDKTAEIARKAGADVKKHVINCGVGAAISTGMEFALMHKADIVVTIDADGQHKPEDIPRMIEPIRKGEADVTIGARMGREKMPLAKRVGNKALNKITKLAYGVECSDTQCGFRAFSRRAAEILKEIESDGYGFASEMVGKIKKNNLRMADVPIETLYIDKKKGTTIIDGFKILGSVFSSK